MPQVRIIPIQSRTDPGKKWPVKLTADRRLVCPCPGYGYRQKCDHVAEARKVLMGERHADA